MRPQAFHLLILALVSVVIAFDLRGQILFDSTLPNSTFLSPTSKISLDHSARTAFIRKDGSFELANVQDGQHILEPLVPGYSFNPNFLTISSSEIHVQGYHPARQPLSTSIPSLQHPLQLRAAAKEDYFTLAPGMNILGLLKSPMVLMMVFSGGMMFLVPKLVANVDIDPEMAKEVAETRKRMQGMQNMDFMGSISNMLAGGSEADPAPALSGASVNLTPSKAGGGQGNGAKRRKGR